MESKIMIFSGIALVVAIILGSVAEVEAGKPETSITVEEMQSDPNIKEVSSRRFRNLTETDKVITVYEVYGKKVAVIEAENEMEIIELDK